MSFAWHDPGLYNAALEIGWVHDLEHWSFFLTSMLLWWNVTNAGPRIHKKISLLARIGFLNSVGGKKTDGMRHARIFLLGHINLRKNRLPCFACKSAGSCPAKNRGTHSTRAR